MKLIKELKKIKQSSDNELEKRVIESIIDGREDSEALDYMKDVMRGGCQSGTVSELIYYADTKKFYIEFMDEIDELYQQTCEETGDTLTIGTPMYNWLSWYGYEQTVFNLLSTLNIEY